MNAQQLVLLDCICLALLAAVTFFTRATPIRFLAAIIGGVAATAVGIGFDVLGHSLGWWHYVGVATPYGPPLMYVAVGLWYGVGLALVGWRIARRFGSRGQLAFIVFMAVYGPVRDYVGVALSHGRIQVIALGIIPVLGDVALWVSVIGVAQAVMWLVAGRTYQEPLARVRHT